MSNGSVFPSDHEIQSLFLTDEQEQQRAQELNVDDGKFFFTIERSEQILFYFAAVHAFDPQHQQFKTIRSLRSDFLTRSWSHSRKVIVESRFSEDILESEQKAIHEAGEVGFTSFLAKQAGIDYECPEPKRAEETQYLQEFFSDEQILYFHIARRLAQRNRILPEQRSSAQEYVQVVFDFFQGLPSRRSPEILNREFFLNYHHKLYSKEPDLTDYEFRYSLEHPYKHVSFTNDVCRKSGELRELSITKHILNARNDWFSLFIVYGESHCLKQQPVLERYCK